jgi:hypothetical protein
MNLPMQRLFLATWLVLAVTTAPARLLISQEVSLADYTIEDETITIVIPANVSSVLVPNLHAPMVSAVLNRPTLEPSADLVSVTPLVDRWRIDLTKPNLDTPSVVELTLEATPTPIEKLEAIDAMSDGGFRLSAHTARIVGEKLRYELLPQKNTVGYWVNADDYAYFLINVTEVGSWNVGVLQGCGKGQGGSTAAVSLLGPFENSDLFGAYQSALTIEPVQTIPFEVQETGHFQNFQWRNLGVLSVDRPGIYAIKLSAVAIAKAALMDCREIQLTRIPK